ncbi:DUF3012 domain-containing protein [Vibrio fluvialis]|uniref:DUF3012 domain-containing protein n=1 Tax=Vibrio fluvialis TaxID=676 RepID=UPI003BF53687
MMKKIALVMLSALALTACENEVGSAGWCQDMREKPKNEWSAQNAVDFAHLQRKRIVYDEENCTGHAKRTRPHRV